MLESASKVFSTRIFLVLEIVIDFNNFLLLTTYESVPKKFLMGISKCLESLLFHDGMLHGCFLVVKI